MREISTIEEFKELIEGEVNFKLYAQWCNPCKNLQRQLEQQGLDKEFIKLDIERFDGLMADLRIISVPTLLKFSKGKEIKRAVGVLPIEKVREFLL